MTLQRIPETPGITDDIRDAHVNFAEGNSFGAEVLFGKRKKLQLAAAGERLENRLRLFHISPGSAVRCGFLSPLFPLISQSSRGQSRVFLFSCSQGDADARNGARDDNLARGQTEIPIFY